MAETSINKHTLLGRLGKDPQIKYTHDRAVANFDVATGESWKDRSTGQWKSAVEWHKVVAWGKLAEIVEKHVHKGDMVFIEGPVKTSKWTKTDGTVQFTRQTVANTVQVVVRAGGTPGRQEEQPDENEGQEDDEV